MNTTRHGFDAAERAAVYRAIRERRDMRHFLPLPVAPEVLRRLLEAAHAAPSVGLTQPWRFIRITQPHLREQIHTVVEAERQATAAALGARSAEFMRLKVQGIRECGELLAVAVRDGGTEEVFGRRLMPQMDLASAACAIQNLWLAARTEGIGVGWVSMFDPERLGSLLHLPTDTHPIALLCIGQVEAFYPAPMLSMEQWRQPRPLDELLSENAWPEAATS